MRVASCSQKEFVVVGAGMGGCLMSMLLGRAGREVGLYERNADLRRDRRRGGRSINLTIAARALHALERLGLVDEILPLTVPLRGRMVHPATGGRRFQPYGSHPSEVLHSIQRNELNAALLNQVEREPGVSLLFDTACVGVDKHRGVARFEDANSQESFDVQAGLIIGADGGFSAVRRFMQRGERATYRQEFLDWGYKEMVICPHEADRAGLERDVLHVWPRGSCLLLAMPNADGSFTCTLVLPFEGAMSFAALASHQAVERFFATELRDAAPLFPSLCDDFMDRPAVGFLMTETDPWHHEDKVVLLGDACHVVLPFYGQGMNAAFEDCTALLDCVLDNRTAWKRRFARYQDERKRNTDALAALSKQNFVELKDSLRSPLVGMRAQLNRFLGDVVPGWVPLYTLVSHTTTPYADAVERVRRQDRILRWSGADLALRAAARVVGAAQRVRGLLPTGAALSAIGRALAPALERTPEPAARSQAAVAARAQPAAPPSPAPIVPVAARPVAGAIQPVPVGAGNAPALAELAELPELRSKAGGLL